MKTAPVDDLNAPLPAQIEGPQLPNRGGLDSLTLQEVIQKYCVPGVSVAVIKDFAIDWVKGLGSADVLSALPVDAQTLFQAASISKPVTAMAVLKLTQEGRMSLDADVNTMLKSWKLQNGKFAGTPVTPRALLSHTSGAGDGFGFPGYDPVAPRPTLVQILDGQKPSNVGPVFFERPPFSAFKYSGGGTIILQLAMTDVLQKPFADIMAEHVLEPLGMADSTFAQPLPPSFEVNAARSLVWRGIAMETKWHVSPEQAAAGLWTTSDGSREGRGGTYRTRFVARRAGCF